jgi:dTDP-D-glucose 4,6-dehydratase
MKKLKWYPKNNLKSEIKEIINWYKINQKYF